MVVKLNSGDVRIVFQQVGAHASQEVHDGVQPQVHPGEVFVEELVAAIVRIRAEQPTLIICVK